MAASSLLRSALLSSSSPPFKVSLSISYYLSSFTIVFYFGFFSCFHISSLSLFVLTLLTLLQTKWVSQSEMNIMTYSYYCPTFLLMPLQWYLLFSDLACMCLALLHGLFQGFFIKAKWKWLLLSTKWKQIHSCLDFIVAQATMFSCTFPIYEDCVNHGLR